jgi:hypothetical protein
MLPVAGPTAQATLAPEGKFVTENCWVPEGATAAVAGLTLVVGAVGATKLIVADPVAVSSFALVAVIATLCAVPIIAGAV